MKFKYATRIAKWYGKMSNTFGLCDWDIIVGMEAINKTEMAHNNIDHYDKKMTIEFNELCNQKTYKEVLNIAIHEIIHGLLLYYHNAAKEGSSAEAYEYQEEMFVNHITKIIERLYNEI